MLLFVSTVKQDWGTFVLINGIKPKSKINEKNAVSYLWIGYNFELKPP